MRSCPSVNFPAPMPYTGMSMSSAMALPSSGGTASRSRANAPASWIARASWISSSALAAVRPCALKPPSCPLLWGVRPIWPMTRMPGVRDPPDLVRHPPSPLQLDGVHARFLEEAPGIRDGVIHACLVGQEGHVPHHERGGGAPAHGLAVDDALIHGDGNGAVVPVDHHTQGISTRIMSIPASSAKWAMG